MGFANPLGLLALFAIPAVLILHLFRRRFRERRVAGLFLFAPDALPSSAGRTRSRLLKTPSLWLELLAALVFGLWLGGLHFGAAAAERHLVVVLDDSASMNAKGPAGHTLERARRWVRNRLDELADSAEVTLLKTGPRPEMLAGPRVPPANARIALDEWTPARPLHDPTSAWELGLDLAGSDGELVFVTDREDLEPPPRYRLAAFGESLGNVAVVSARRISDGDGERVFVDLMAWGDEPQAADLLLEAVAEAQASEIVRKSVTLTPGRTMHLAWTVPAVSLPIRIRLSEDALENDNVVTLLPEPVRVVPVYVSLGEEMAAMLRIAKVLGAIDDVDVVDDVKRARLVVAAEPGAVRPGGVELVVRAPGDERDAWVGPFLVERRRVLGGATGSALLSGISLQGVVWSAGRGTLPGLPLVLAGEQVLLSEEAAGAVMRLHLNLDPKHSNLASSPDWPILLLNLVEHVRGMLPGPVAVNVRVGGEIALRFRGSPEEAAAHSLIGPFGGSRPARGWRLLTFEARQVGIHRIVRGGQEVASFAVNFVDPVESDLTGREEIETAPVDEATTGALSLAARGRLEARLLALLLLLAIALDWFVLGRRR